jgi:hypothetical protein
MSSPLFSNSPRQKIGILRLCTLSSKTCNSHVVAFVLFFSTT